MDNTTIKSYKVHRVSEGDISLTGDGNSIGWRQAACLDDFSYPWEKSRPRRTSFKAVHDERWVYFLFDVEDSNAYADTAMGNKLDVIDSARVEIFFRQDEQLSPYYCLEIDAVGRVLDYKGHHHRQFDFAWSWPANGLNVAARRSENEYTVEIAISKQSLHALGLLSGSLLQAGLFRAECTHTVNAREHMRWISWVKPAADTPDFHIPSSFGVLSLDN